MGSGRSMRNPFDVQPMPIPHILIALFVVAIWSFNFIAIKVGLAELPPIFMAAVRFALTALPAVFFIKPPAAPFWRVTAYGMLVFALQFGLLFYGMAIGMSAAVGALALQLSVFVTIGLAWAFRGERMTSLQFAGAVVSALGLVVIATHTGGDLTLAGLLFGLAAAACWGAGNIVGKSLGKVDMLALVVWSSLAAPLPLFALSYMVEGPQRIAHGVQNVSWLGIGAVAYIVYASTHVGYSLWAWLMARHPAGMVAPFTLLGPVVAALFSAWLLGETFPGWKIGAGLLVLAGLLVNVFGGRMLALMRPRAVAS